MKTIKIIHLVHYMSNDGIRCLQTVAFDDEDEAKKCRQYFDKDKGGCSASSVIELIPLFDVFIEPKFNEVKE